RDEEAPPARRPSERDEREGGDADRPGNQTGDRPEPGDGLPVQAHRVAENLLVQHDLPRPGAGRQGARPARQDELEGPAAAIPRLPPPHRPPPVRVPAPRLAP